MRNWFETQTGEGDSTGTGCRSRSAAVRKLDFDARRPPAAGALLPLKKVHACLLVGLEVGAGGDGFPSGNFLVPLRELVAKAGEGDLAQDEVQRWFGRVSGGEDGLYDLLRVAGLLAGLRLEIVAGLAGSVFVLGSSFAASLPERPRKSVRNGPGSTMVTWTPRGFISAARASLKPSTANLVTL